jgi:cytochrome P450
MLSFNTSTAMHAIYGNPRANVQKANWYKTLDAGTGDFSTQTVIDKKEHAFRRRVLSPAFSDGALRDAEKYIDANVRKLMQKLGDGAATDGWTEPKNFATWSTAFGFDFIGDLSFGSNFNLLDGENAYMPGMMMGTSKFVYYVSSLCFICKELATADFDRLDICHLRLF